MAKIKITKRGWLFIPLFLSLVFIGLLFYGLNSDKNQSEIIKPFPAFSAENMLLSDQSITKSVFDNNINIINVWASWCVVCQKEHGFLLSLANDVQVNMIGLNYRDKREAAINWIKQKGNPYKAIIYDPQGKLAMELGVIGTPETYLVDKFGVVCFRYSGELNEKRWNEFFLPKIVMLKTNGSCDL